MTSHKDYRLDQLGIPSQYEADELERDLNVRFDMFTYNDREVWVQQNAYLDAYAHNRAVSDSADVAGVPVSIAQNWNHYDTLGFKRRLEIADLRFSDSLQVLALERVREPDAPAALLIALLRAHIPEKFSTNGHICDTSKDDEQHFFYAQDAKRELEAGHPGLSAIADGTYQPHRRSLSHDDPTYTGTPSADAPSNPAHDPPTSSVGAGFKPAHDPSVRPEPVEGQFSPTTRHSREHGNPQSAHPYSIESDHETPFPLPDDDIEPIDPDEVAFFNLSPEERKSTPNPSAPSPAPSVRPEPVEGQFPASPRHSREHGNPQSAHPHSIESDHDTSSRHEAPFPLPDDDIEPIDPDEVAYFNLPPSEREDASNPTHDPSSSVGAGFKPAHDPSASSASNPPAPSVRPEPVEGQSPAPKRPARLIASLFQKARPDPNDNHDTFPVKRF